VTAASTTSITLRWRASRDNVGVAGYYVYSNGTLDGTTTSTSYLVDQLACGTAYTLKVVAFDRAGNRSAAASLVASTSPCPAPATPSSPPPSGTTTSSDPDLSSGGTSTTPSGGSTSPPADSEPPSVPASLVLGGATASSLSVSWAASSDNVGVASYGVYLDGVAVASPTSTAFTFSGLTCGVTHQIAVDAVDANGNRSDKASLSASTAGCPDTSAPSSPVFLVAPSATTSSITVSWLASYDNVGVTGYGVYRGTTRVASVVEPALSYTFTGLQCGTSYTLQVDAYDAAGNVSPKSTVTANTSG
jgi:chitinase